MNEPAGKTAYGQSLCLCSSWDSLTKPLSNRRTF
jgi:hypothetical protein